MNRFSPNLAFFFLLISSFAQAQWTKRAGGASTDLANGLWVDEAKNVFVTGSFSGQAKFFKTEIASKGGGDVYVTKYNAAGSVLWVKTFGGKLDDFANAITGDPEGNLYLTGIFTDTAWFENESIVAKGTDIFVLKLSPAGKVVWIHSMETLGSAIPQSIAVTDQGGVYVGGLFSGKYSKNVNRTLGQTDGFVTKLTWQGENSWTKVLGGPGFDEVNLVKTDPWGRVVASGVFDNTFYVEDQQLVGFSSKSAFVIRMEATGNVLWSKGFSGIDSQVLVADATSDLNGNVYLTGKFSGESLFGDHTLISKGQCDIFVCSITPKGHVEWISSMGGTDVDEAVSISYDGNKSLYVGGLFNKVVEYGRKSEQADYDNQVFIGRWDTRGNLDEMRKQDFNSTFHCAGHMLNNKGEMWVCGSFTEKTSFGKLNFVSAGEEDMFITSISDSKIAR